MVDAGSRNMPFLRSLRSYPLTVLQICRAYGTELAKLFIDFVSFLTTFNHTP